jgi:hypothetical protein
VFNALLSAASKRAAASLSLCFLSPGDLPMVKKPLSQRPEFTQLMGLFQGYWSSLELTVNYAICQFLNVTTIRLIL